MNAALFLVLTAPATGTGVFTCGDLTGARVASDRRIALGDQRVAGQAVLIHVVAHVLGVPMRKRVHFDPACGLFKFKELKAGAAAGLVPFATGDPTVKPVQRLFQRKRFTQGAAGILVREPQGTVGVVGR